MNIQPVRTGNDVTIRTVLYQCRGSDNSQRHVAARPNGFASLFTQFGSPLYSKKHALERERPCVAGRVALFSLEFFQLFCDRLSRVINLLVRMDTGDEET